ncbi:male sterility protein-domain-containing protein [Mycena leptocephala]|nr:male sterility protein-domain-containing protein [Mycena leptocephala]
MGRSEEETQSTEAKTSAMGAMAVKYTENLPKTRLIPAVNGQDTPARDYGMVVLVTGTTGALGCYLLARLLQDPRIDRVYAFNRAARQAGDLPTRQKLKLIDRGLDPGILGSEKLLLLEGDLAEPNLGVSREAYEELYKRVTHIIHSAWPVNFNITVSSFEPNIQGLCNLVDFSLTSPFSEPRTLLYTSSVSVFHSTPTELHTHPEVAIEAAVAAGNGYQQSKWIAEEILRIAGESYPTAKMLVVRVRQLCGGTNGAWNAHEWVPAIVQSGKFVGCLPDDSRDVSWIPVHRAAGDFLGLPTGKILHLINPKSVPWRTLVAAAAFELNVQLVPYADWLSRLETATSVQKNVATSRASHLLYFFRSLHRKEISQEEAFGLMKLDMVNAISGSESLRVMDP